jgi:pimeloyl-ACP methyl ester carboxylesterase
MHSYQLGLARLFFGVAGRLAPGLAVRAAARLFTTPVGKRRLSDIEREVLDRAERFVIPYSDGLGLVAYRWGDRSAPVVLFVHGWTGTATSFVMFIEPLVARGFQVVAYDGLAHGASPGRSANLIEWTDGVVAAMQVLNRVHCVVGHSLGAGSILIASSAGLNTDRIVLIAPLTDIVPATEAFARVLSIPAGIISGMRDYVARKYRHRLARYGRDWIDIFQSSFQVSTLIVHDKDDKEIAWEHGRGLAARWPWAEFVTTEGLGHRRILINTQVVNRVTDFISAGV